MKIARILATAAIVVSCGSVSVQAQSATKTVPAEFPPASFAGRQYIDSKGCAFIRAGVDGAVTWVPRMSRSRQLVCGFQPTLSSTQLAAAGAARATARPAAAPAAPRLAPPPVAPAPVTTRKPPSSVRTTALVAPMPDPAPRPTPRRVAVNSCTGASALSQAYIGANRPGFAVRCGPQNTPHVTGRASASTGATIYRPDAVRAGPNLSMAYAYGAYAAAPLRVAPRHVYEAQKASTAGIYVPPGYTPVWEDDRLNPRRAHQTLAGKVRMDATWTRTVPRRLIIRETGAPVVATRGRATPLAGGVVVSTRGRVPVAAAPAKPRAATPASHRYVQLGAFADPDHARRAAQRVANSGLPARIGGVRRDGKAYTLVLAGPFDSQKRLEDGLRQVRGMGFGQAVLRR